MARSCAEAGRGSHPDLRRFGSKGLDRGPGGSLGGRSLKRCAEEAGKKGITLGVEDDGGITTTAERTVEIVTKAASPWVGIDLDVGNFVDDAYQQIELCAPYATNVHFKSHVQIDHKRQDADWPRILGILGKSGYRGYLAIEYELTEEPRVVVPKLVSRLRDVIRGA